MADEKAPVVPAKPDFHLVVKHEFDGYQRGQKIEDADEIASVLAGDNHRAVMRVFPR